MLGPIKNIIHPIHKEGNIFILIFGIVTLFLYKISEPLGWIGFIATVWCVYFFRDPARVTPRGDNWVVSPADGMIQSIISVKPPSELDMGEELMTRISIFLNVFDVHVNRIPISGTVEKLVYHHGKFLNASLDKASEDNERQSVKMQTKFGSHNIAFVQIAGLIARRIVCDLKEGETVVNGARYGIIRFGSRVDIYLPQWVAPKVIVGQKAIGGETILANLEGEQRQINGDVR